MPKPPVPLPSAAPDANLLARIEALEDDLETAYGVLRAVIRALGDESAASRVAMTHPLLPKLVPTRAT